MTVTKPHSQCTAQELMNAISIEVLDGIATLEFADEPAEPIADEPAAA